VATRRMNSLELAVLEPYENGELKPHTVGIIRDIEAQNEQYEVEDKFERKELRRSLEIRLVKKFDKSTSLLFPFLDSLRLELRSMRGGSVGISLTQLG
jgi:hypothetical protein